MGREIQKVLELVRPLQVDDTDDPRYIGYCGVATEAYLHLAHGERAELRVKRASNGDGTSHWWPDGPKGVIDLMYGPADRRKLASRPEWGFPYEQGKGAAFRGGAKPSNRAAAIIQLVESRRQAT